MADRSSTTGEALQASPPASALDKVLMLAGLRGSILAASTIEAAQQELAELRRQATPVESLAFICPDHGRQEFRCFGFAALVLSCGCRWEHNQGSSLVRVRVGGGNE